MNSSQRGWLIVAIVLLGFGEIGWHVRSVMQRITADLQRIQSREAIARHPVSDPKVRIFSSDEVHAFLASARRAEAITDLMQRCLAYPDPPGSHWSPAAVKAYCQYNMQSILSYDDAKALIQAGRAADLDQRFEQDLQAQFTKPEAKGLLDHTFFADFNNGSPDVRSTLDTWKRASPSSAFAYAASGFAYVEMAYEARGGAYISDTPQSNIDAMEHLLTLADADLQWAIALNPKVTPAYVAMIHAGAASLGRAYLLKAAQRGLAIAPDDYAIYGMLSSAEEPRWGGSLKDMARVAAEAQAHAKENPLLVIMLSTEPAYEYDVCDCNSSADWSAFPVAFDNVPSSALLLNAGHAANDHHHADLALIYLSEALRFLPWNSYARMRRNFALTNDGESAWALEEADGWVKEQPQNARGYSMRGYAYESNKDYVQAAWDLTKAADLDPGDTWPLAQLGRMYVYEAHDWDKGWDAANRLMQAHPEDAEGWVLRAKIQKDQPRAGLNDTIHDFITHFGDDPSQRAEIERMRLMLLPEAKSSSPAVSVTPPSHG